MEYRRNWIYEGMDVADKSQIDVKMTVSRILRQLKRVRRQVGEEVVYEEENQIIGVGRFIVTGKQCVWLARKRSRRCSACRNLPFPTTRSLSWR